MTTEQQRVIDECNVALSLVGLTIETLSEVDGSGNKIGAPIPPKKK